MRFLVFIIALFAIMPEAGAREPAQASKVASATKAAIPTLAPLAQGLLAVRGHQRHVKPALVRRLEREAKEVIAMPGNGWMKPHILLGLAVTESDLRGWLKRGYGTVADCGLTQVNLTRLRMTTYKKRKLCRAIRKNTKLAMVWTMKELNTVKARYCTPKWLKRIKRYQRGTGEWRGLNDDQRFWMCVLNVYNQGPRFVTYRWNTCKWKHRFPEDPSQAVLDKRAKKCRSRNRYWLRTMCFATGIRLNKTPKYARRRWTRSGWKVKSLHRASCRRVWTWKGMQKLYSWKPLPAPPRPRPTNKPVRVSQIGGS